MIELNVEGLEQIRRRAVAELEREDRRQRMAPLREAMFAQMPFMNSTLIPEALAESGADARLAHLSLEASIDAFPERLREAEARMQAALQASRRRTEALRRWLEALS